MNTRPHVYAASHHWGLLDECPALLVHLELEIIQPAAYLSVCRADPPAGQVAFRMTCSWLSILVFGSSIGRLRLWEPPLPRVSPAPSHP